VHEIQPEHPVGRSFLKKQGYVWATLALFLMSLTLHWILAWQAYVDEEEALGQQPEVRGYLHEVGRDTFENWQSEFLQLVWQVAGLSFLLAVGSPQSKEGDDRKEAKLDEILQLLDPQQGKQLIEQLDKKYPKH
jgi:hypothetical protein